MNDHVEELINLWCDGQCDDQQIAELETLIHTDPSFKNLLVERIDQHHALMDLLGEDLALSAQVAATIPATATSATINHSSARHKKSTTGRFVHSRSFRKRKKSSSTFAVAASIACAAMLIVGVVLWQSQNNAAPVAWISSAETQELPIYKNQAVDAISSTQIRFADGSIISASLGSRLSLNFSSGNSLSLTHGSITASIEPQDPKHPFRIITPHALFTVIGTAFQITTLSTQTDLAVHHGSVRVQENGKAERIISDGENYLAGKPHKPEPKHDRPLITDATQWRYYDRATPPPTQWLTEKFDDSEWPLGLAPFGYDVDDDSQIYQTNIDPNGSRKNDNLAVWFRSEFEFEQQDYLNYLIGEVSYDDGIVIYINGVEVTRMFMPPGPITGTTAATTSRTNAKIKTKNLSFPASYLKPGKNTIAVSIHQRSQDSTDVYFMLHLTATHLAKESP